jgi:RNA polymerase sigma-70 factor (ECF subfamily)
MGFPRSPRMKKIRQALSPLTSLVSKQVRATRSAKRCEDTMRGRPRSGRQQFIVGMGGRGVAIERWQEFEDEELVVASLLGEIAAFDVLVLRYRPAVLAAVSRQISRRELAEDICQEAFLLAFKALPQLTDRRRFPAWLHMIARRQAIRYNRGEARASHTPLDELILEHSEVLADPGWDALERQEEQEWVRQAMATLPDEFQLVLSLRYWSEMPLERIAGFLGLPLSTVKWRLHRARELMRARLLAAHAEPTDGIHRDAQDGQDGPSRRNTPNKPVLSVSCPSCASL